MEVTDKALHLEGMFSTLKALPLKPPLDSFYMLKHESIYRIFNKNWKQASNNYSIVFQLNFELSWFGMPRRKYSGTFMNPFWGQKNIKEK